MEGHFFVPHPYNRRFLGRETVFKKLIAIFSPFEGYSHNSVAISGLGGIGKTQIAAEYAHRHREQYSSVFWVVGASRQKLVESYLVIASKLFEVNNSGKSPEWVAKDLKCRLEKANQLKWLLIVDGADDVKEIHDLLPRAGHVLVTTRDKSAAGWATYSGIEIEPMCLEDAITLFLKSIELDVEEWDVKKYDQAQRIVMELGCLPLAIDQSAAYIRETHCSLANYLEIWMTSRIRLLKGQFKRQPSFTDDYRKTIAGTWMISFKRLAEGSPTAAELLSLFAFLDCDSIPETLLKTGLSKITRHTELRELAKDELLYNEAISSLNSFSLIYRRPDTDSIQLHVLLSHVIRDSLEAQGTAATWAELSIEVLANIFPARDDYHHDTTIIHRTLISHVNVCLNHIKKYSLRLKLLSLFNDAGLFLFQSGDYGGAERCFKAVISTVEPVSGRMNWYIAEALINLSQVCQRTGQWDDAQSMGEEALSIIEPLRGQDHIDCVRPLRLLGRTSKYQGKRQLAKSQFGRAMKIVLETPDADLSNHGRLMLSLGRELCYEGKWDAAYSQLNQALETPSAREDKRFRTRILVALGTYFYYGGNWEESRKVFEEGLRIQTESFGLDSPGRASLLGCLGSVLIHEEDYAGAAENFQLAIELQQNARWKADYGLANYRDGLGCAFAKQGKLREAETQYQLAVKMREKWQGADPSGEVWTLNSLAAICAKKGEFSSAKGLLTRAFEIRKQTLGLTAAETQDLIRQLICLYQVCGDYQEADDMSHKLIPETPTTEINRSRLGSILWRVPNQLGVFSAEVYLSDGMDGSRNQKVIIQYETFLAKRCILFPMWKLSSGRIDGMNLTLAIAVVGILSFIIFQFL